MYTAKADPLPIFQMPESGQIYVGFCNVPPCTSLLSSMSFLNDPFFITS